MTFRGNYVPCAGLPLFIIMILSLCVCLHDLNQFYNFQQSTLRQEVRTYNNGLLSQFLSLSSSLYISPLQPHNSALLGTEGKRGETQGGGTSQLSGTLSERERERSLLFLHSGWPFGSASTLPPPPPPSRSRSRSGSPQPLLRRCVAKQRRAGAIGAGAERFREQIGG